MVYKMQDLCYNILTRKYSFLILLLLVFSICVPFKIQGDCFTLFFFTFVKLDKCQRLCYNDSANFVTCQGDFEFIYKSFTIIE